MKRMVFAGTLVCAVLLLGAAFFDLPIARALFNPHSLAAAVFSALGMLPQGAVFFLGPAMIWAGCIAKRNRIGPGGILLCAVFTVIFDLRLAADMHSFPAVIQNHRALVAAVVWGFIFALLPFAKKHPDEVLKAGLILALTFFAGRFVLDWIKVNWGRQRFFTMTVPEEQFTRWFLPQGRPPDPLVEDHFKSFPSGHSFSAMLAVGFSLLPSCVFGAGPKAKKWSAWIALLAVLFGFTVMVSRLVLGWHFLSDVTFGAALSLLSFAAMKTLVDSRYRRFYPLLFPDSGGSPEH